MKKEALVWVVCCSVIIAGVESATEKLYDPCCSYPCQNFGICNRIGFTERYYCDCYGTDHYGDNCETPTWGKWLYEMIRPTPFTVQYIITNGKFFWGIVNRIESLRLYFMGIILDLRATSPVWPEPHNTAADYTTWDGYANKTYWGRTLPPVPKNCPTPMGVAGPKELPDVKELVEKVFTRTEFKPCPRGTSVLLPFYGQHFTHQGFKSIKSDMSLTWGSHTLDLSHLYGETLEKQFALRAMKGGKMKMQVMNGEEYPPNEKDCPGIDMGYPSFVKEKYKFAMGHPFFALLPSLLYWSTLWLREHNRLCDILVKEHPDWDDERLFQTSRLIILGELHKVTVDSYIQHISGMHLKLTYSPELLHDSTQRWSSSRIHIEFNTLYHFHSMMPDYFLIGGDNYTLEDTLYNMEALVKHGMHVFTTSLSSQSSGRLGGGRNMHKSLHSVAENLIKLNRKVRLQPFNRYRQYFRLPPHKTFEELTGETRLAKVLSDLYGGDIDAVEYFIGIMVEQLYTSKISGLTLMEAIGNYAFRTLFSNTIGSPEYWKESTFGGKVGFDIVKSTNVKNLACRNIKGCPDLNFLIPEAVIPDSEVSMVYNDLEDYAANAKEDRKTEL